MADTIFSEDTRTGFVPPMVGIRGESRGIRLIGA